ncbi:MAG: phosphatase PAP2 family protein [Flavisolibacter sp.]
MKYRSDFLTLFILVSFHSFCQQTDTLMHQLDSLGRNDSTKKQINIDAAAYNETTKIDVPTYFILLASNAKQQLTGPFHTSKKSWKQVGGFALLTGALAFADEPIQKQALKLRNNSAAVRNVSRFVTDFGASYETYTLTSLAAYGFIFKNEKVKTTTFLATQAYITGGLVECIAKFLTGRQRPSYYGTDSIEAEPTFHGPFDIAGREYQGKTVSSSFPSGHTTVAFAAATVFAMEYRDKPFIPILAYSAASLVGLSRITENKHWATDVLVGAGLGYLSGRQVVRNYHRYARLQSAKKQAASFSFTLQYNYGQWQPGFVYKF